MNAIERCDIRTIEPGIDPMEINQEDRMPKYSTYVVKKLGGQLEPVREKGVKGCNLMRKYLMIAVMRIKLVEATKEDAKEIAVLRNSAAEQLTAKFGKGPWSGHVSEKGVLLNMRNGKVFAAKTKDELIATLALSVKKPWAIDKKYFSPAKQPLHLTAMAIAPALQRNGIGRECIKAALKICREWPADAIRLDAYNSAAGAGVFYQKCGFTEVGRATYRETPLVYYEMRL